MNYFQNNSIILLVRMRQFENQREIGKDMNYYQTINYLAVDTYNGIGSKFRKDGDMDAYYAKAAHQFGVPFEKVESDVKKAVDNMLAGRYWFEGVC